MSDSSDSTSEADFDDATLARIRERTLRAEKKQLHKRKPHNIIPEIEEIIKEEVQE